MQLSVKIRKVFENAGAMKAIASVTLDDSFAVHSVKVIVTEKGRFIAMPNEIRKGADGADVRKDIFHPISSSARKALEDAVLAAYESAINHQAEQA